LVGAKGFLCIFLFNKQFDTKNSQATAWLFKNYSQAVIKKMIINYGGSGELDNKSLNYWCVILKIRPQQ